ncbi:MAG TPA: FGGY family carbohydrate kinase [Opitutaceae bacterium]|nr:FGGY family carbohydrate kinase [Opitutaceae bacterium]HND61271.1 FGGY family carbohydrate kinase [Opitutaceae bacterium]
MGTTLGLDIGSSSVIAGILRGTKVEAEAPRAFFRTRHSGQSVEVDPDELLRAVRTAIAGLGGKAKQVDAIHLAVMCPAWVALDRAGRPLTPIVTHQDRRSVAEAKALEARLGKQRHLNLCGCRPFPGGISSTTWAWFRAHQPARLKRADLVGHLNTFLHRRFTGARVTDPSNASFTGLYHTLKLSGWSEELCANLGVSPSLLPEVLDADRIGGTILPDAAKEFGLRAGTPMIVGLMDGSAGMLLAGAKVGQLFNVCGSTDVLALCTNRPKPHERLLTRALGVDGKWLQVSTLAAAASAIYWVRDQFFNGMPLEEFRAEFRRLARQGPSASGTVRFEPYMAGERTSIDQRQGAFTGLTLASNRTQMLSAVVEGLIRASAERLPLLAATGTPLLRTVAVSGGSDRLDQLLHRDWPGRWKYRAVTDATMRGLGMLTPR